MNMFNRLFCKKEIYGNAYKATKAAEDQKRVVANEPKNVLVFKGGEPTIAPIKIYHDDDYVGSIKKRDDEFVFESYVCMTLNYNVCAKITEKLKELNDGSNI